MVGFLGLVLLKSTSIANRVKEKTAMTLFLKDNVSKKNIDDLKASLDKEVFTKKTFTFLKRKLQELTANN